MSADPVVRYTAGAILVIAFLAAVLVVVHGYWVDPHYAIPAELASILSAAIGGALSLLGVHLGAAAQAKAAAPPAS